MTNPIEPPKQTTAGDVGHALVKAAIAAVPYAGSAASELFTMIVAPPFQRRQADWMESVGAKFLELENKQAGIREELQNDPGFIDTLLQATQAAVRSSDTEKRTALRNAVMNSVADDRPDDSRRQMFVNMIDEFTPWHLRILVLLDDPTGWFRRDQRQPLEFCAGSAFSQLVREAFSELQSEGKLCDHLARDLYTRGLLKMDNLSNTTTSSGEFDSRTTVIGKQFVQFISEPA